MINDNDNDGNVVQADVEVAEEEKTVAATIPVASINAVAVHVGQIAARDQLNVVAGEAHNCVQCNVVLTCAQAKELVFDGRGEGCIWNCGYCGKSQSVSVGSDRAE